MWCGVLCCFVCICFLCLFCFVCWLVVCVCLFVFSPVCSFTRKYILYPTCTSAYPYINHMYLAVITEILDEPFVMGRTFPILPGRLPALHAPDSQDVFISKDDSTGSRICLCSLRLLQIMSCKPEICTIWMHVFMHACTYVNMFVCMYVYIYIYIYVRVYVYVCMDKEREAGRGETEREAGR